MGVEHTVLRAVSVVSDCKHALSCCDALGDAVLAGTEDGTLLVFSNVAPRDEAPRYEARARGVRAPRAA